MTTFAELGLAEPVLRALAERDYTTPTPIQIDALPVALAKRDLIACAQTGSGKTAVFALPWLHHRHNDLQRNGGASGRQPEGLVLVPTRELAIQVADAFAAYGKHVRFRVTAVYGGVGYGPQTTALTRGVDVLVATPGRLIDHLERGNVRLDGVKYLVLDEADRMLDLGFLPQVRRVLEDGRVPKAGRQTLLFSATMPPQIAALAKDYLHNPERVEVDAPNTAVDRIEQRLYPVAQDQKPELLARLLRDEEVEAAIVFCRTRRRADKLSKALSQAGLTNAAIHSDVAQNKREQILDAFRSGKLRLMIATDVASRGLDIPHLSHVINLDVPTMAEDYVHRIGRTGRAGRDGIAMTLYSHTDEALWQAVEALTGLKLAPITVPDFNYMIDDSEPLLTRRQQADRNRVARAAGQGVPRARGERSRQPAGRAPAPSVNGRSTSSSAAPARAAATAGQTQPSRGGGRADGPARSGDGRRVESGGRTDAGGRGRDGRRTDNSVRTGDAARRSDNGVRGGDGRRPDPAPRVGNGNGNGVSRREPAAAFGGRPAPRQDDRRSNEPRRDDRRPAEPRRTAPAEVGSRPVPPDRQARGVVNIGIEPRRRMTPEERAALLASDGPARRDDDR